VSRCHTGGLGKYPIGELVAGLLIGLFVYFVQALAISTGVLGVRTLGTGSRIEYACINGSVLAVFLKSTYGTGVNVLTCSVIVVAVLVSNGRSSRYILLSASGTELGDEAFGNTGCLLGNSTFVVGMYACLGNYRTQGDNSGTIGTYYVTGVTVCNTDGVFLSYKCCVGVLTYSNIVFTVVIVVVVVSVGVIVIFTLILLARRKNGAEGEQETKN
jgi:hypothetical protein